MWTIGYGLLWMALIFYGLEWRTDRRWARWAAVGLTAVAGGVWTAALAERWQVSGHWPMSTRYEFGLAFAWALLLLHLLATADTPRAGGGGVLLALALATWLLTRPPGLRTIIPLPPALRSIWFPLHTLSAALAYGLFGVAAGLALTGLMEREEAARNGLLRRMERAADWGFLWLTLSIFLGGIWARDAWGRYWGWDPKETWTLIVWLEYLIVRHLRPLPTWRGRRQAVLVLLLFAGVLFLWIGVPWIVRIARLNSLHGF
ncbi:MAG: cytochrome c biogenesis protein CcsA [Anaerolineae bacterium]|nr:cytochrome c biogenesis protein CcsA [Anaerolineae bacterium]MDW8067444.1 cytochrome c biogenesis protein CcsA [Anaerolineae bacterium]